MNKNQLAVLAVAVVAVGGVLKVKYSDGVVVEVDQATLEAGGCFDQPPGLPQPPCLPDGTWDTKRVGWMDAGCLAQVCPRLAEIRASGKSQIFWTKPQLDAKARPEKGAAVPLEEAAPAGEVLKP